MIFKNEFKRIMRPVILVFLVVVSVLWYIAFMKDCNASYLDYNMGMPYAVAKEYIHRFGTSIDFNEIEEIKKDYEAAKSELNISAVFKAQAIGNYVRQYNDLLKLRKAYDNDKESDDWFFGDATAEERKAFENRLRKDEIEVFSAVQNNFDDYSDSWSLLIFICCAIIIIPMLVKNKINNVISLQYASKQGKRILLKQLSAALSAGLLICVILIIVFQLFFFNEDTVDFIPCPINLRSYEIVFWYDFTLLGYMICLWAKTVFLVICEILALFWISCFGNNYITAIALSIPVIVVLNRINDRAKYFLMVFEGYPQFLYPLVIIAAVLVTVVISAILMRKAKKADYLG